MKYLKIQNDGVLDIRLVALMGGSTKTNDKYKIGQFGTGLKYTLAYLYRNNIGFKIFSGTDEVVLSTEKEVIKDSEFEIICINNNRTSITTQMGLQWTAWMIVRELWCNALDEGGSLKDTVNDDSLIGEENKTSFYIQVTPEIKEVLHNWAKYFIQDREPISDNEDYAIYCNNDEGKLRLFKHGVLIYEHPEEKSLFYYDIKAAEINELREFRGHTTYEVSKALQNPSKEAVSYFLENISEKHYEGSQLDYDWFTSFAQIWEDALDGRKISSKGDSGYYSDSGVVVDFSNVLELPKKVYKALVKDFTGIGVLAVSDDDAEFYETENKQTLLKIKDAILRLEILGYVIDKDVNVKVGVFRDSKRKVSTSRKNKTLLFSELCKEDSFETICEMIIGNNEFLNVSCKRDSPTFLTHLVLLLTKQILSTQKIEA